MAEFSYDLQESGGIDLRELGSLAVFKDVDLQQFSSELQDSQIQFLQPGETLFEKEQLNDRMYVILDGRLSVHFQKHEDAIAVLEKGDPVGEMSIIGGQPTSAFVKADTRCRLLAVSRRNLWAMIRDDHRFATNLLRMFAKRLLNLNHAVDYAQQLQMEYKYHATTDALTGLYNRRWLDENLAFEMSRCEVRGKPLSLLMIDIDHFKRYNDKHGHLAGDQALKGVATSVIVGLRGIDMAVRYGGEEVVVVLPGADTPEAENVSARLHDSIHEAEIYAHDGKRLPRVSVSIGIAPMQKGDTSDTLTARADAALYRAKHKGRNCTSY